MISTISTRHISRLLLPSQDATLQPTASQEAEDFPPCHPPPARTCTLPHSTQQPTASKEAEDFSPCQHAPRHATPALVLTTHGLQQWRPKISTPLLPAHHSTGQYPTTHGLERGRRFHARTHPVNTRHHTPAPYRAQQPTASKEAEDFSPRPHGPEPYWTRQSMP